MTATNPNASRVAVANAPTAPVVPSRGALLPLGLDEVRIAGGFWADRQRVNATATLQHCLSWIERLGWLANFERSAVGDGRHEGREFSDSEVYKLLEALAWESARTGDAWAERTFIRVSEIVVRAQRPDGYLNTNFGNPGQAPRYTDPMWGHELYCAGHLIQAAVARLRTHGSDPFVDAAIRLADHIVHEFGPDGRVGIDGHPEVEVALVELGRATGDFRYIDQAQLFIERRGNGLLGDPEIGRAYFQDDIPVRDAEVLRGHAVRALYLSAGAADVAAETGDDELMAALARQWTRTVARRTYLTGGMGSRHEGESFGDDWELPSDRAYSETCAGVGSVMFSWRMLLAGAEERYADLMERTLFNVLAASPDESGTAFFYVNPLQRNSPGIPAPLDRPSPRASSSDRAPWFDVSCCPPNVARTLASLAAYIATKSEAGIELHQFAPATIETELPGGRSIALEVETAYPMAGDIKVRVTRGDVGSWRLRLRVPSWAAGTATAELNGKSVVVDRDHLDVRQAFTSGDVVVLHLPVEPRWTFPDRRIDDLRGTAAVEVGPLVLCAESVDLHSTDLLDLTVDPSAPFGFHNEQITAVGGVEAPPLRAWPFGQMPDASLPASTVVPLLPYFAWAERGPSTMRVWLPLAEQPGGRDHR